MKEFIIFLRIAHAINKELVIEGKLLKHRCRMVKVREKYSGYNFKNHVTKDWYQELDGRITSKFS